jgi:hypothetical protein
MTSGHRPGRRARTAGPVPAALTRILYAALPCLALSCGHSTYHPQVASVSKAGVTFSVLSDERCFVSRDSEKFPTPVDSDRFHLAVKARVENGTDRVVVVAPEQVRLVEDVHGRRTEMAPNQSAVVKVQPRTNEVVALEFERAGALDCHHPLDLEAANAVTIDDKPVGLDSIHLVSR